MPVLRVHDPRLQGDWLTHATVTAKYLKVASSTVASGSPFFLTTPLGVQKGGSAVHSSPPNHTLRPQGRNFLTLDAIVKLEIQRCDVERCALAHLDGY